MLLSLMCVASIVGTQNHALLEVNEAIERLNVDSGTQLLISSIIAVESRFDPLANSFSGARGVMQLTDTAVQEVVRVNPKCKPMNFNVYDVKQNTQVGFCFIKYLTSLYKNDIIKVLAHFNGGLKPVRMLDLSRNMNYETANYIIKVSRLMRKCEEQNDKGH